MIAFVPPEDVFAAFETLEEHVDASLNELMAYFEEYYIGKKLKHRRKAPLFCVNWWNVYHRTLRTEPRTNNNAEAGFRRLQAEFNCHHPTLWRFIKGLRRQHLVRDLEYNEVAKGQPLASKEPKLIIREEVIMDLVIGYESWSILEYLGAIAHNIMT